MTWNKDKDKFAKDVAEEVRLITQIIENAQTELVGKRDKEEKIKGTELDTSVDDNKIKLINLSDEVQQAMSGGTADITAHESSAAPHQYGGKFEWRYNETSNSLDLVVLP